MTPSRPDHWRDIPSAPSWGRSGLWPRARAVAVAVAEAALATHEADDGREGAALVAPADTWVDRIVGDYDEAVGHASGPIRFGINLLLVAFNLLPCIMAGGGFSPLRGRTLAARLDFLERVENHRLGSVTMAWIAIKVPLLVSAFEEGLALRETGFDRPHYAARRALPVVAPSSTSPEGEAPPPAPSPEGPAEPLPSRRRPGTPALEARP
ncbi:MAG: hypothetical protein AAF928_03525 [Myxococcota bacterium]